MRATQLAMQPVWMPRVNTTQCQPAGRWWDAIVVPQLPALDALEILDHETGRTPGPTVWDQSARLPRLYFLVPPATAAVWDVPGTIARGSGSFVVLPGPTTIEPPGVYWLVPPDPEEPEALVDPAALRSALLKASGAAL